MLKMFALSVSFGLAFCYLLRKRANGAQTSGKVGGCRDEGGAVERKEKEKPYRAQKFTPRSSID